jgi:lipoprotein-anchoring transpeptidase ErfK/SrfK
MWSQEVVSSDAPLVKLDRATETALETQVELHRRGFSCGAIDGVIGGQTVAALRAIQRATGLRESGIVDRATRDLLRPGFPALATHTITAVDLEDLRPVPTTWLEKSEQPRLTYATTLELLAERYRAHPNFLKRLNPTVNWEALEPGVVINVPAVEQALIPKLATQIVIRLEAHELELVDAQGSVIAHFPVSIARKAEKRPVGELHVVVTVRDPNYTFDPEVFTESAEAKELGRKLLVPPGPNNPVGRAWIGLDLPGYGIHGTPDPEKVGRTESHGCFRLANWDALTLLDMVRVGMPVLVEP